MPILPWQAAGMNVRSYGSLVDFNADHSSRAQSNKLPYEPLLPGNL